MLDLDRSGRTELERSQGLYQYKLLSRLFGALLIAIGLIWLTGYNNNIEIVARFSTILGGMLLGRIPRKSVGLNRLIWLKLLRVGDWTVIVTVAILLGLSIYAPIAESRSVGQIVHYLFGTILLFYGGRAFVGRIRRYLDFNESRDEIEEN